MNLNLNLPQGSWPSGASLATIALTARTPHNMLGTGSAGIITLPNAMRIM